MVKEEKPSTPAQHGRRLVSRGLGVAMLALTASVSFAQTQMGTVSDAAGNLTVTVDSLFDGVPPHGYLPLRVTIKNDTSRAVSLRFDTSSRDNNYWSGEKTASGTFSLGAEAGQSAEHEILAPLVPGFTSDSGYGYGRSGASLTVKISGGGLPERSVATHSDLNGDIPCVALSTESHKLEWDDVKNELEAAKAGSGSSGGSFGARFAPERLPSHWRGFSGFEVLVFREDEWGKVAPTTRAAVLDWVRMGGRLVFWGADNKTPLFADLGFEQDGRESGQREFGLGSISTTVGREKAGGNNLINSSKLLGFGPRLTSIDVASSDYDGNENSAPWGLQQVLGIRTFNSGQIVIILIAFGVIVGPVNLFMLAKPGRRHRLFITTPIISVAASLIIAALIFIQDGFGGKGVRSSVTFIDPGARKAYTTQEQIARTGVLLGRSFTVEEPLVITPVVMEQSRWTFINTNDRGSSLGLEIDDKTYAGDWFRSRSEQGLLLQMALQTRESVQVLAAEAGPNGEPVVLSTIAYPLARLAYVDAQGTVWTGENIVTGEKATLTKWEVIPFREWWDQGLASLGTSLRAAVGIGPKAGPSGRFYAVAADGGKQAMIETLPAIKWENKQVLVFGITETVGKGGPPAP